MKLHFERERVVHENDIFMVGDDTIEVEFRVILVDPQGYGIVNNDTLIARRVQHTPWGDIDATGEIRYEKIGGYDAQLQQIRTIIDASVQQDRDLRLAGNRTVQNILLRGPPGTGKTLIARAIDNEREHAFVWVSGYELFLQPLDTSMIQLAETFEDAVKMAPSVIFVDQIDSIASVPSCTDDYRLLSHLLGLMDRAGEAAVVVMAATNRPELLDPDLRRFRRFDREISVGVPDLAGRLEILKIHTEDMKLDADVDLEWIAGSIEGYVGWDIVGLCKAVREQVCGRLDLAFLDPPTVAMSSFMRAISNTRGAMRDA